MALSNYRSPRPRPIHPDIFFDVLKLRRLIEDATDLAVRAANGTTSAALGTSISANHSPFGGTAAALGLGSGTQYGHTKLSRERRHRMRELATQKLSQAYQYDEIAASVAMMQGASSLEDVAKTVLQRSPGDSDARYVHFFHEKIPSRMMAECTDLSVLDEVVRAKAVNAPFLRTRAVTRLFKADLLGALQDLTDALRTHRHMQGQHGKEQEWQILEHSKLKTQTVNRRGQHDTEAQARLEEHGVSRSLELQLLFHRAGVYLSLATLGVETALSGVSDQEIGTDSAKLEHEAPDENHRHHSQAQKAVKMNAKRALRDYLAFLAHFEYTPGLTASAARALFDEMMDYVKHSGPSSASNPPDHGSRQGQQTDPIGRSKPEAEVQQIAQRLSSHQSRASDPYHYPEISPPKVYQVCDVFSQNPPPDILAHASPSSEIVTKQAATQQRREDVLSQQVQTYIDRYESVTYHPLLTDALHSLLLCHCLLQTPQAELLRHARMVARLTRYSDGYPIFLAARSPSRSDWIQLLQYTGDWIGLGRSWEDMCAPVLVPEEDGKHESYNSPGQTRERRRYDAIAEALADERVHDAQSFQAVLNARDDVVQPSTKDLQQPSHQTAKKIINDEGKDHLLGTDRARAIARWINEAPQVTLTTARKGGKGKGGRNGGKCGIDKDNSLRHSGGGSVPHDAMANMSAATAAKAAT